MLGSFLRCLPVVLRNEGGSAPTNDPADPGGTTKYGISQKTYPELDIAALTLAQAQQIYERDFWNPLHAEDLPDGLALCVFDAAVNHGVVTAIRLLQRALGVKVDGVVGAATKRAALEALPMHAAEFMSLRLARYEEVAQGNERLTKFLHGWRMRVLLTFREAVLLETPRVVA